MTILFVSIIVVLFIVAFWSTYNLLKWKKRYNRDMVLNTDREFMKILYTRINNVIYDKNLKITSIENIQPEILLEFTTDNLVGLDVRDLEHHVSIRNRAQAKLVADNVVLAAKEKRNRYFEYESSNTYQGNVYYALCFVLYNPHDGTLCSSAISVDRREIIHAREFVYKTMELALETANISTWVMDTLDHKIYSIHGKLPFNSGEKLEKVLMREDDSCIAKYKIAINNLEHRLSNQETVFYQVQNPETGFDMFYENKMTSICDNATGEVCKIVGALKDVSEEYKYRKELEEFNRRVSLAIKTSALMSWTYDRRTCKFAVENEEIGDGKSSLSKQDYFDCSHPDDLYLMKEAVDLMEAGLDKSFSIDVRLRSESHGRWLYTTINGTPLEKDSLGYVVRYTGFRRNDTQIIESHHKLIEMNELFNNVINRIPTPLIIKDIDDNFNYTLVNKAFCDVYGFETEAVIGKNDFELFDQDYASRLRAQDMMVLNSGEPRTIDEYTYSINRERVWQTTQDTFSSQNAHRLLLTVAVEMTERVKINKELNDAKNKAEASNRLKSAFLANMSHEIRTPLNAIVGFSNLIADSDDDGEKEQFKQIISSNNELLLRLIGDILDLSKIESGLIEVHREEFDVVECFNEIATSMKHRITNPNVTLKVVNPYTKCIAYLDKNRFSQITINFATNAIKYTPQGEIVMGYEYVNGAIKIYVKDTGIGISEEKKPRVFGRFEKLDDFAQGTGLGLSICKAIADTTNGEIGFESEEGKGSLFWYCAYTTVKIEGVKEAEIENGGTTESSVGLSSSSKKSSYETSDTTPVISSIQTPPSTEDMNKKVKILVAEDNNSNFILLQYMLKNYDLVRAETGVEAVKKAKENNFSMIFMDMKMPAMGGLEATKKIREFNIITPIIALTAHAFGEDKDVALRAGCNGFLTKPINRNELMKTIDKYK